MSIGPRLFILVLMCLLTARPAVAQVNLGWDECGSGAVMNKDFACNTNSGEFHLIGSFIAPAAMDQFIGAEVVIDLCSMEQVLPSWWFYVNAGTCRATSLSASALHPVAMGECVDLWKGGAVGGIASYQTLVADWNSARLILAYNLPNGQSKPLTAGTEYFAFDVRIDAQHTVGTNPCPGCTAGACIILNQITLLQRLGAPGGDQALVIANRRQHVTWQGGVDDCPFPVPTRNTTWGRLKGMYR